MKKFLIAATCLVLLAPAISSAQPDQNRPGRPGQGQGGGQRPGGPGGGQNRPNPGNRPGGPGMGGGNRPNPGGGNRPNPGIRPTPAPGRPQPGRPGGNRPGNPGFRPGRPGFRPGNRPGYMGWNGRRVHGSRWNWPSGYGYQRWSIGGILPGIFLSQAYWYADYASLGFEAPPWGYQWVRYGPDLLLVQIGTGRVVDVEYGVFY